MSSRANLLTTAHLLTTTTTKFLHYQLKVAHTSRALQTFLNKLIVIFLTPSISISVVLWYPWKKDYLVGYFKETKYASPIPQRKYTSKLFKHP
jgi:hypothetical protein